MDEMERYINRGSDVPEYIVRDLPKEGMQSVIFAGMQYFRFGKCFYYALLYRLLQELVKAAISR